MKLIYYIAVIICVINVIYAKDGIFERTNCISDGNEICGQWDSLCCSGKSVQAEDAYDCWLLFPIVKRKIRVCGDKLKKDKSKEKTEEKPAAVTTAAAADTSAKQVPINDAAAPTATSTVIVTAPVSNTSSVKPLNTNN